MKGARTIAATAGAIHPDDLAPPGWHRLREMAWHLPRYLAGLGPVGPRGPEDGPPALVLPGFLAGDRTTMDLRRALARAGWRVHPWGLGMNRGARHDTLRQLGRRLDAIYDGRPILLIGWSLGGMFARELAHADPLSLLPQDWSWWLRRIPGPDGSQGWPTPARRDEKSA